ncbi:MAG: hypothetical protein [Wendovervirus sonii]|uniref:YopX protein domain-containing protein n=1 Tax=phage Lak_Megaphage_Sonny TaxID=3109229 RepID=A0ABZ0Z2W8_9CAUD|nr:MAG: hypothetical protein [phage Lak_Megaphage_Sonny]
MKPEELMLGDIVMYKHQHYPTKLTEIHSHSMPFEDMNVKGWIKYGDFDDIEPIQLTPEILKKNGWKDDNNISDCLGIKIFAHEKKLCGVEFIDEACYSFNVYERWEDHDYDGAPIDWGYRYVTFIFNLHYIHELQHALRLCKFDELANDLKI